MNKYVLALLCLFFLTIVSAAYAQEINGIDFNIPSNYNGGNLNNGIILGESYVKGATPFDFRIDVFTRLETYKNLVGESLDEAYSIENISINGRPAVLTKYYNGDGGYMRIYFESSNKLVSIQIPNTNPIDGGIVEMIKNTPDSSISQDDLNNILQHSLVGYNANNSLPNKDFTINGLTFTIPGFYQNGKVTDVEFGNSNFQSKVHDSFFRISVFSNLNDPDSYIGYTLTGGKNVQETTIANHPVVIVNEEVKELSNFTKVFFESGGKIVLMEVPYKINLTDREVNIIASSSAATLSEGEFKDLMLKSIRSHETQNAMEEASYVSFTEGYYSGSNNGYHNGYGSGFRNGLFAGMFASRL